MASQANGHSGHPDPKVVGNEFVKQYYNILHTYPHEVHKFYQDASEILRPGPDGEMTSITTVKSIDEHILSVEYNKCKAEISSADSQASHEGGVLVLVTGHLTGKDNIRRLFTQSFFLAPQQKGFSYYVLSDIFRYVEDEAPAELSQEDVIEDEVQVVDVPVTPEPEPAQVSTELEVNHLPGEVIVDGTEVHQPIDNGDDSVVVQETVANSAVDSSSQDVAPAAVATPSVIQEDAPKKSFASIVNALKNNSAPFQVRSSPVNKVVEKPRAPPAPEAPEPNGVPVTEKIGSQLVKRYSVFVGNLPMDATPAHLEVAFKSFGPIKRNGIQVRSSKGSCYGFVEFESEGSMRSALEVASIEIGNRTAHIEEQKNEGNDRGRVPQGRGGFRNDNFRGRGNFAGGRGFGRNDFERKFDYPARGVRNGGGYNKDFQNGGGRGARQVVKETTVNG